MHQGIGAPTITPIQFKTLWSGFVEEKKSQKRWIKRGNGYTCTPWDIGRIYTDGCSLWVLWKTGIDAPVGYFEDLEAAMKKAKDGEIA